MSPSAEKPANVNLIALRVAFGLLGLILASPVVWDLAGWSPGVVVLFTGITTLVHGIQGAR